MLKPCANSSVAPFFEVRLDVLVELRLREIRSQERDEPDALDGFDGRLDGESVALRLRRRVAVWPDADDDVVAGVAQIHRMRAALAAVAEHRDLLAAERARIDIRFRKQLHRTSPKSKSCAGKKNPAGLSGAGFI